MTSIENVEARLHEDRIVSTDPRLSAAHDLANHDACSDRRLTARVGAIAGRSDQVDDLGRVHRREAGFGHGDGDFRLPVVAVQLDGDHTVEEGTLRRIDACVLIGVAGEDRPEVGMHPEVALTGPSVR